MSKMNLKHVRELVHDASLTDAYFYRELDDFEEFRILDDKDKETLIDQAEYYWCEDESGASIATICNTAIKFRKEILNGTMSKWKFLNNLEEYW